MTGVCWKSHKVLSAVAKPSLAARYNVEEQQATPVKLVHCTTLMGDMEDVEGELQGHIPQR